jgi:hypothetical protein
LPIVLLYGHETWSLTLRQEYGLKVIRNRALRRIFGPMRDEMVRGWKKLHNEERRLDAVKHIRNVKKNVGVSMMLKRHS